MAHFAKINNQNIVEQVIVVNDNELLDENENQSEEKGIQFIKETLNEPDSVWVQTSYNTHGGVHNNGKIPFRKNYATVGGLYDIVRDAFIPRKRYGSWILNENTCLWESPTPMPNDGKQYIWDEITKSWTEITE